MPEWRLLRCKAQSGAWNMALDEALLNSVEIGASPPLLRLYRWQPATVTLGYFQQGSDVVNLEACRRLGYDVVRRVTGGRAVLHDDEVTYAVIAPEVDDIFPGSIASNYHVIAEVLHATLAACGQMTTIASGRRGHELAEGVQKSACFTAPALSELVYAGCKMTGSAQKRLNNSFLQHGSIPVNIDLLQLYRALHTGPVGDESRAVERLAARVGWLNRFLTQATTVDTVEEVLIEQFSCKLGIHFRPDVPTADETAAAEVLMAEKYGNKDWTLRGIVTGSDNSHQC